MKSRDFCFWLQGYFELINEGDAAGTLSSAQAKMIKQHLALVFKHEIDPAMGGPAHQQALNETHSIGKPAPQLGGVDPITGMVMRC